MANTVLDIFQEFFGNLQNTKIKKYKIILDLKTYIKRVEKSEILKKIIEIINFWKRKELRMKIEKMIVVKLREYLTKYIYIRRIERQDLLININ